MQHTINSLQDTIFNTPYAIYKITSYADNTSQPCNPQHTTQRNIEPYTLTCSSRQPHTTTTYRPDKHSVYKNVPQLTTHTTYNITQQQPRPVCRVCARISVFDLVFIIARGLDFWKSWPSGCAWPTKGFSCARPCAVSFVHRGKEGTCGNVNDEVTAACIDGRCPTERNVRRVVRLFFSFAHQQSSLPCSLFSDIPYRGQNNSATSGQEPGAT